MAMKQLSLSFFGTFQATLGGQPLTRFRSAKAQGLFVYLALTAPQAHGREVMATWQIDWNLFDQQRLAANGQLLPQVQHIIQSWLGRITDSARQLLTAASVLAKEIRFDHLCHVAALDQFEALTALDELLSKQLLLEANDGSATAVLTWQGWNGTHLWRGIPRRP